MQKHSAALVALALAAIPQSLAAQPLGVGVRGGTWGVGAESALDVSAALVLRGGIGYHVFEPEVEMAAVDWALELRGPWYNVGLDAYLNPAMRVGAGVLFKPRDPHIAASLDGPVSVGGRDFTADELGSLIGRVDSGTRRPYLLVGFGRHTRGSGLFLDLGVLWFGDPEVLLESNGGSFPDQAELDARLRQGESDIEADLGTYLKVWPILSLGARIALR